MTSKPIHERALKRYASDFGEPITVGNASRHEPTA